jgi:hypothetical protein
MFGHALRKKFRGFLEVVCFTLKRSLKPRINCDFGQWRKVNITLASCGFSAL